MSFNYDCGPAPGGDRARPYFMLDWKSARIDGDRLQRNGQAIGKFENDDVVFEMDQQLNGATIHHRVTLRRESQNRVILEHVTSTFGVDVRLVHARTSTGSKPVGTYFVRSKISLAMIRRWIWLVPS